MRYYNGNFIRKGDNDPTTSGANGIYNLEAHLIHRGEDRWPPTVETFTDPTLGFVEFSRRFIASDTYMSGSGDYDGNYDVSDIDVPGSFSGSARVYIGCKISVPTGNVFYNDVAIACIQILNSAGTTLLKSWNWSGGTHQGWQNKDTPVEVSGVQAPSYPESLATAAAATYGANLGTSQSTTTFSIATSTGSSYTGAADGISSDYSENGVDSGIGTILPSPGDAVVAQATDTNYIYREASSSTRFSGVTCRSPAYTFSGGEIIRIAHCLPGYSQTGNQMNPNDTLYIGIA